MSTLPDEHLHDVIYFRLHTHTYQHPPDEHLYVETHFVLQ